MLSRRHNLRNLFPWSSVQLLTTGEEDRAQRLAGLPLRTVRLTAGNSVLLHGEKRVRLQLGL